MYQAHTLENIFRFYFFFFFLISKLNIKRIPRKQDSIYIFFFLFLFFTTIGTHRLPPLPSIAGSFFFDNKYNYQRSTRGGKLLLRTILRSFYAETFKHRALRWTSTYELMILTIMDIDSAYNIFWWNFIGKKILHLIIHSIFPHIYISLINMFRSFVYKPERYTAISISIKNSYTFFLFFFFILIP